MVGREWEKRGVIAALEERMGMRGTREVCWITCEPDGASEVGMSLDVLGLLVSAEVKEEVEVGGAEPEAWEVMMRRTG